MCCAAKAPPIVPPARPRHWLRTPPIVIAVLVATSLVASADPDARGLFGLPSSPSVGTTASPSPEPQADTGPLGRLATHWRLADPQPFGWTYPVHALTGLTLGSVPDASGTRVAGAYEREHRWRLGGLPVDDPVRGGLHLELPLGLIDTLDVQVAGADVGALQGLGGEMTVGLVEPTANERLAAMSLGGELAPSATPTRGYQLIRGQQGAALGGQLLARAAGPLGRLGGFRVWHREGVGTAFRQAVLQRQAARLRDEDGDGQADVLMGQLAVAALEEREAQLRTLRVTAVMQAGARGAHDDITLTLLGGYGVTPQPWIMAISDSPGRRLVAWDGIAMARWHHTWPGAELALAVGWQRQLERERGWTVADELVPQRLSSYVPAGQWGGACDDGGPADAYPELVNCPVFGWLQSGGAGRLMREQADRPMVALDASWQLGRHRLRLGAYGEVARVATSWRFSGGVYERSQAAGQLETEQWLPWSTTCATDDACMPVAMITQALTRRSLAGYVADRVRLAPAAEVELGLKYAQVELGQLMAWRHQLAPRLGFRARPAAWLQVEAALARALGEVPLRAYAALVDGPPALLEQHGTGDVVREVAQARAPLPLADARLPSRDDALVSLEARLPLAARLRAWGLQAWQRAPLARVPTRGFGTPTRLQGGAVTTLLALEFTTSPRARRHVRMSYQWQDQRGASEGWWDPTLGEVYFMGPDYDTPTRNQTGRLPGAAGHRVLAELGYTWSLAQWRLEGLIRGNAMTQRPTNVRAEVDGQVFELLPRGSGPRLPVISAMDLRLRASRGRWGVELNVQNAFNQAGVIAREERYTYAAVRPIEGGSATDLLYLRDADGALVGPAASYGRPLAYQPPVRGTLQVSVAW